MRKILMVAAMVGLSSALTFAADMCTNSGDVYFDSSISNGMSAPITPTNSVTCTIGGFTFSNFDVAGGSGWVAGSEFDLTVSVDNPGSDDLAFSYSNPNGVVGDFLLTFTVTPGLSEVGLFDGTATSVIENVCTAVTGTYGASSTCVETLNTSALETNNTAAGPSVAFSAVNPSSSDVIVKDVNGGSELYQDIVPEPMTLSLMGFGLLGIGILGRRFRR